MWKYFILGFVFAYVMIVTLDKLGIKGIIRIIIIILSTVILGVLMNLASLT